jgi:hypothetical protein
VAAQPNEDRRAVFSLVRRVMGIARLEEEGQQPLTPQQAKSILALLKPLRTQATLTGAQATRVLNDLNALLTSAQREELDSAGERRPQGDRPVGGPQNMEGRRPSGPPSERRPGGMRGPGMMEGNPFNPPADNPMAARMAERWQALYAALEAKAKE